MSRRLTSFPLQWMAVNEITGKYIIFHFVRVRHREPINPFVMNSVVSFGTTVFPHEVAVPLLVSLGPRSRPETATALVHEWCAGTAEEAPLGTE